MMTATELESLARTYLAHVERGDLAATLGCFASDVEQQEFPNRLVPDGKVRDLQGLREAAERGQAVVRSQRYEVLSLIASGDLVAIEARWTATLAVPVGSLPAGGEMRARLAMFIEFRDGLIVRQRNYDCFEPF